MVLKCGTPVAGLELPWLASPHISSASGTSPREARLSPAIPLLRLLAVLNVLPRYASLIKWGSSSGARLVLAGLARTLPVSR